MGVIVMKVGMYMMCRKSNNPSVQAFALDHINDVCGQYCGVCSVRISHPALCSNMGILWHVVDLLYDRHVGIGFILTWACTGSLSDPYWQTAGACACIAYSCKTSEKSGSLTFICK